MNPQADGEYSHELLAKVACSSCSSFIPSAPPCPPPSLQLKISHLRNHVQDAMFISPHKLPGGPGTTGVLVVKRKLLQNSVPSVPGGGTVLFVSPTEHRYLEVAEEREEGGTRNILGAIRCGLVFRLKVLFLWGAGFMGR